MTDQMTAEAVLARLKSLSNPDAVAGMAHQRRWNGAGYTVISIRLPSGSNTTLS
jgi:hypothetical protein